MKTKNNNILSALAMAALGSTAVAPATAAAYGAPYGDPNEPQVQTEIRGGMGNVVRLPLDGSTCDPRVIRANLAKLRAAGILENAKLTVTVPVTSGCYSQCSTPQELQAALQQHCGKAQKLAEIVQVVQRR